MDVCYRIACLLNDIKRKVKLLLVIRRQPVDGSIELAGRFPYRYR